MLVSFGIKLIERDQKQRRDDNASPGSPTCFPSSLLSLISKDTYVTFYFIMHLSEDLMAKNSETN